MIKHAGLNIRYSSTTAILNIILIIIFSSSAIGETGSDLFGPYSCIEVKEWANSDPEKLFKMWANNGKLGDNRARAIDFIIRGGLNTVLKHMSDVNKLIQSAEWSQNPNLVRDVTDMTLDEAKAIDGRKRKIEHIQGELKNHLDLLKQVQPILVHFQAMKNRVLAMTCQDTTSQDCIDTYNLSLSMLGDLTLDAGDIEGFTPGTLDGLKASSISLDGKLDAMGPNLETEYKTKVAEYCKNAKAGIDSLQKTISLAKMSNPEIAARATQAKGHRDKACAALVVSEAKAAADNAKNAATEAHLLSNLVPLLPSDIATLSPPAAMDISGLEAQLASMEQALTTYEKSVSENFKKWEKFRSSVSNVRSQLSKVRSACGKGDIIKGVAIDLLIGRIEGKLKSIESTVPDVRAENNALGALSRELKQNSTYLKKLKGNHEKYRECLKKVPDTKALVDEAKKLLQEAKDNVGKAERYAKEAADCYNKLKNKSECDVDGDCPDDQICEDGKCVDKPKLICTSDSDCPVDYVCKDGDCVYQPKPKCISDSDCPVDYVCKDGECDYQPKPKCISDDACPVDYVCKDGGCVYQKPIGCQSDGDCSKGYVCDQGSGKCVSPFDGSYGSFIDTQDQREGGRSQDQSNQAAADQSAAGGSSSGSGDLSQDLGNIQVGLTKPCQNDTICPPNKVCRDGVCVDRESGSTSTSQGTVKPDPPKPSDPPKSTVSPPQPTPPATVPPPQNPVVQNRTLKWNSPTVCNEAEGTSYGWLWLVDLKQSGTSVSGNIYFHKCPGGGRASYSLSGKVNADGSFTVNGRLSSSRGALADKASQQKNFTLRQGQTPSPSL